MAASYTRLVKGRQSFAKPDAVDNVKYDLQNVFKIYLTMNQKSI